MRLMRVGEVESKGSTSYTPPTFGKEYDLDEDHSSGHQKKSVLAKVKEKARKWRSTLSKKKRGDDNNPTPSWGVSLDDDEDEDPESLGTPSIYESEIAPQDSKGAAKQHPRSKPVISEKHVLPSSVSYVVEHDSPDDKQPVAETAAEAQEKAVHSSAVSPTLSEKVAPGFGTIPDVDSTASKFQDLTVSTAEAPSPNSNQKGPSRLTQEASGLVEPAQNASAPVSTVSSGDKSLVDN